MSGTPKLFVCHWYQRPAGSDAPWESRRFETSDLDLLHAKQRELGDDTTIEIIAFDAWERVPFSLSDGMTWFGNRRDGPIKAMPGEGVALRPNGAMVRVAH